MFIAVSLFVPVHYLYIVLFVTPLHVCGEYLLAQAYEAISQELGNPPGVVSLRQVLQNHGHYIVMVCLAIYKQ